MSIIMMIKNMRWILDRMADNIKFGGEEKHKFVKNPRRSEEPLQGSSHTLPHFNTEKIQTLWVFLSSFCR